MNIFKYCIAVCAMLLSAPLFSGNPTIGLNFTAVTAANGKGSNISAPQNPTAAVGQTQFITSCYPLLRSFNKSTGKADGILNIDANAFTGNAILGGVSETQDVWMIYHQFINRFMFSCESDFNGGPFSLQFIVNDGSSITPFTTWTKYTIPNSQINPNGGGGTIDFQQPAFDQNAWYNAVGTFDSSGNFIGSSLTVVSNSSILAGTPNITVFPGLMNNLNNLQEGFACPATNFDPNPEFGYLACLVFQGPNYFVGNQIQIQRILNAGSNTPTLGPVVTVTLPASFASASLTAPHKGNLFGTVGGLQVTTPSLGTGVHVRNHQLYLVTDNQIDSSGNASATGDRYGIIWWQFDLTGDTTGKGLGTETPSTVPVLVQSGTIFDKAATDPLNYFMVSIMTNKNSDMMLSFNTSGNKAYINTNYAFRASTDPKNTTRAPVQITNTQFPCNYTYNLSELPGPVVQRWGDQSAVVVDPSDNTTFWLNQPFAALQNAWGVQVTQILIK